jgi:hypothetical protein
MTSECNNNITEGPILDGEQTTLIKEGNNVEVKISEVKISQDTIVFTINEDNLKRCPRVKLIIGDREVISLLDSGADNAIMSTELFEYLMKDGFKFLQIPIVNCVLVTAFGNKSKKIRSQALIEFKIDQTHYELAVILAPNMATDFILGMNFMIDYKVQINFPERIFKTSQGSISSIH